MQLILILTLILPLSLEARPKPKHPTFKTHKSKVWTGWQAGGTCTEDNTQVIEAGDALSILLDRFGVDMPQGQTGDGTNVRNTCWIRVRITPPPGRFLTAFRQTYRGGILKSRDTQAQFQARYQINNGDRERDALKWKKGQEITPASPESLFAVTYEDDVPEKKCGRQTTYAVNMVFSAHRKDVAREFVVGGLDSIDVDWRRIIQLEPVWANCR